MEAIAAVHHELDDDVFFADLSKQISLLIMDDDDDDLVSHSSSVSLQGFSQSNHYPSTQQSLPFVYDQQACRRESKGTGVFIPTSLISQPRRKNKNSGKNNNSSFSNSKLAKNQNQEKSSRGMILPHQHHHHHHVSYNHHKPSNYDSFKLPKELY
ncbi:OLC1v1020158C1 [Oldenlandia corymbosa var. corymbosa]|uniref:OLC1v1020158C1 n=1 Tax=Oldenlandia corymbosa var. corymbosa TaxID=529605 RepID=A0AAV1EFU9_OLDCO|nr:OLC1v1020158C1 [Oldenlandia corymbosa var. corymbosa]